ncbi:MAG: DUF1343 domain-containing protein [Bacteriovoracaceae bacterium]|nr:DUF1343 domain-containing protein [Bacteriovoracaceae bacterium]
MAKTKVGLDLLSNNVEWQRSIHGNIAYLCHSASLDSEYNFGPDRLIELFGDRVVKFFGPQHGFVSDVQDNMIETKDFVHPHYKRQIVSLYSNNRKPTPESLDGIDTMIIDLQDVGSRVYTYIHTMTLMMEACAEKNIAVVILDRPNPIGGVEIEGNILEKGFESFVGRYPIPMRHAMTMAEMALFCNKFYGINCNLSIIPMEGWRRNMLWEETNLAWVNPSPNLPTPIGSLVFPGTVLLEGTNISEGRGTTRSLELIGHPKIEPWSFYEKIKNEITKSGLDGFVLRPLQFLPMFQKHAGKTCGGFQIHPTDIDKFKPWRVGQFLIHLFIKELGKDFSWKSDGYEYQFDRPAIDFINGSEKIREWAESSGDIKALDVLENENMDDYLAMRKEVLLY